MDLFLILRTALTSACVGCTSILLATPVVYDIDSDRSTLTISGHAIAILRVEFAEQSPGSLTGHLQGTIRAEHLGNGIAFSGGSHIDALPHPAAPFVPSQTDVGSTSLEDNFGGQDDATGFVFQAAVRDATADILDGTSFFDGSAAGLELKLTRGTLDINSLAANTKGSFDLNTTLESVLNLTAEPLTREVTADRETITIPVLVMAPFEVEPQPDVLVRGEIHLEGQIVASRRSSVPGDTNGDLKVDLDDLNNVRNRFGDSGPDDGTLVGDTFPFDGLVNIDDLNSVRNNFGDGAAVVPEPASALLALPAFTAIWIGSRGRRQPATTFLRF